MQTSWRLGRIANTNIKVHISFGLIFIYLWLIRRPEDLAAAGWTVFLVVLLFACVALHEVGHMLVAQYFGIRVSDIILWPLGGFALLEHQPSKSHQDLLIASAGPLVNLILAGIAFLGLRGTDLSQSMDLGILWFDIFDVMTVLSLLVTLNLSMAIFNLIPAYPLDGGRILRAGLAMLLGDERANQAVLIISVIFALAIVGYGKVQHNSPMVITGILVLVATGTLDPRLNALYTRWYSYLFERGYYHLLNKKYDKAIAYYDRVIPGRSGTSRLYHNRGWAHVQVGNLAEAIADYNKVIALAPMSGKIYTDRGYLYTLINKPREAMADYSHAIDLGFRTSGVYEYRGHTYLQQHDTSAAITDFNEVIRLHQRAYRGYALRGLANLQRNDLVAACADLEHSMQLKADDIHTLLYRSLLRFRQNDLEGAQQDATKAIDVAPRDALVHIEHCLDVLFSGNLAWAEMLYQCAERMDMDAVMIATGRGDAYRVNEHNEAAVAEYDKALAVTPTAELMIARAQAFQAAGQTEQAAVGYRQVLAVCNRSFLRHHAEVGLKALAAQ